MKTGLSSAEEKESMIAEVQRGLKQRGTAQTLVGSITGSPRNASGESGGGCGLQVPHSALLSWGSWVTDDRSSSTYRHLPQRAE